MIESSNFQEAVQLIDKSRNVLITAHARPDGDACGSVVAMAETLAALGKNATVVQLSEKPNRAELKLKQQVR